jgi:hypothetical protein
MNCCDEYGDCRQGRDCPVRKQSTSNPKDFWDGYVPEPTRPAPITTDMALDLALEALEYICEGANNQGPHTGISWRCVAVKAEPAITAIKQARSAPVLETRSAINTLKFLGYTYHGGEQWKPPLGKCPDWLNEPAAQRQWVGLSDLNIDELENEYMKSAQTAHEFLRAIEAKLKELNT